MMSSHDPTENTQTILSMRDKVTTGYGLGILEKIASNAMYVNYSENQRILKQALK